MSWYLSITPEQFDHIYRGTSVLADKEIFTKQPETEEEYLYYAQSKLWRMNNWYKVVDKVGDIVWFVMNPAQHIVYARQLRHAKSLILKARQRGISTFFMINYFDDAITTPNLKVGMQSYGLEESATLLERLDTAWTNLSDYNKGLLEIGLDKNNTKAMSFTNGSSIRVAVSFRGDTLHRLHVSELGKIANKDPKKARELKTGTLQAIKPGNPVAIESTAEGRYNAFYDWWYGAIDNVERLVGDGEVIDTISPNLEGLSLKDFDPVFLSWVDDTDCEADIEQEVDYTDEEALTKIEHEYAEYVGWEVADSSVIDRSIKPDRSTGFYLTNHQRWWYVGAMRELGDKFHQEYPHTPDSAFDAAQDGAYYAKEWRARGHLWRANVEGKELGRDRLYDPELLVHTAWDLGMNDTMVCVFFQVFGRELRIIDEYHNSGEGIEHYTRMLADKRRMYGYAYGRCILPHDAKVKDLTSSVSRKQRFHELGVRGIKVLRRSDNVNDDIEQVRKAIEWMWVDAGYAGYIAKMMTRYTKKWDEVLGAFKDKPLHDEWSNPADAVRYMVLSKMHITSNGLADSMAGEGRIRSGEGRIRSNVVDGLAM